MNACQCADGKGDYSKFQKEVIWMVISNMIAEKRKEKKITFSKNANPTNLKREYTNQSKNIKYKI